MSKQNENTPAASTASIFTSADVKAAIEANITALEMERGKNAKCSAEQYAAILFMTLADLGLLPTANLPQCMQAWDAFPKSPSAFRQILEREEKGATSAAASSIMAKLMQSKTQG